MPRSAPAHYLAQASSLSGRPGHPICSMPQALMEARTVRILVAAGRSGRHL